MNTLENTIQKDLEQAMKNKIEWEMLVLRAVKTSIMEVKTAPGGKKDLEDGDIIKIIQKMVKERRDTAVVYRDANRKDLAAKELVEANYLQEKYLPKMLSESEIEEIVAKTIADFGATSMKDMGKVMGFINKTYAGQVDGSVVSKIVKSKLS